MVDGTMLLDGCSSNSPNSNHTLLPPAASSLVHEIISDRAKVHSDAEAICSWDCTLSYGELDLLSSRLASQIVSNGVRPETIVPLVFEKSGWTVLSMLAVMKAGGAFLPLDISQPKSRLRSIVEQSGAQFGLCSATCYELCSSLMKNTFAVTENTVKNLSMPLTHYPAAPNNAAYVMSTSGSTGTPKIVVTEHSQLASFAAYLTKPLGFTDKTRALQFASYAFDPIIGDIFLTLSAGGTVCIPSEEERKNDIVGAMRRMRVNLAKFTPSFVDSVADLTPAGVPTLKTLVLGGEATLPGIINRWAGNVDLKLIYGSTECTISCVFSVADTHSGHISQGEIGSPVGSQAWVTNPTNVNILVEDGEVGELVVGGPLVSRGYRNNASQTESKFISPPPWLSAAQTPFINGCRFYRTGDLVRRLPNGNLAFVGRVDNQIKIRGQRLELEDVELRLRQAFTTLSDVKVNGILVDAATPLGASSKQLIAFISLESNSSMGSLLFDDEKGATIKISPTTQSEFAVMVSRLEDSIRSELPSYMVPSLWIPIDEMPFTPSRKRDRQRLRKAVQSLPVNWLSSFCRRGPGLSTSAVQENGPMTENEKILQRFWSSILSIETASVSPTDNFFHLGGDSLQALRLVSKARQEGHRLTIDDIFASPVLKDLAARLTPAQASTALAPFTLLDATHRLAIKEEAARQCHVNLADIEDIYPFYSMQEHYINGYPELSSDITRPWDWQQQIVFLLPDGFDISRFKSTWNNAVARHALLRTRAIRTPHGMFQVVLRKQLGPTWREVDELEDYVRQDNTQSMSFGDALLRLTIATSGQNHYFVLTMQHLIYDAYSRDMLFRELDAEFLRQSPPSNMPPPMNQFISYMTSADRKSAIDFWSSYLKDSSTRPLLSVPVGSRRVNELHVHKTTLVKPSPLVVRNYTMATLLEVSVALALAQRLQCADVIFYSDRAGRNLPVDGIQDLMAPTTLFLPTRVHIDRAQTVNNLLCSHQAALKTMIPYEYLNWTEMREVEHLRSILAHSVNLNINPSTSFGNLGQNMGLRVVGDHETRDDPFNITVSVGEDEIEWEFYYDEGFISHTIVSDLAVDLKNSFLAVWEASMDERKTVGDVLDHLSSVHGYIAQ